jgi:hypothetical protein
MTEDPTAVEEMVAWGGTEGFTIAYTNNSRTDGDVWNPDLRKEFGLDTPDMSEQVGGVNLAPTLCSPSEKANESGGRRAESRTNASPPTLSDSTVFILCSYVGPHRCTQLRDWSARLCHRWYPSVKLDASHG